MKRQLWLAAVLSLAFGTSVYATNDGPGCGLGGQVMKGKSGVAAHLSATSTNATGFQTIDMTLGTSGCKQDAVVLRAHEQEAFVATNLGALNQEMAQGQGQHVAALASLMGCPATLGGEFASMSQESYGTVFAQADTTATGVLASLKDEMGRRPALASTCSRIS